MLDDPDPGECAGDGEHLVAHEQPDGGAENGEEGGAGDGASEDAPDVAVAERERGVLDAEHDRGGEDRRRARDDAGDHADDGGDGELGERDEGTSTEGR